MPAEHTGGDNDVRSWRGLATVDEQRTVSEYFDAIAWDRREPDAAEMTAEEFLSGF